MRRVLPVALLLAPLASAGCSGSGPEAAAVPAVAPLAAGSRAMIYAADAAEVELDSWPRLRDRVAVGSVVVVVDPPGADGMARIRASADQVRDTLGHPVPPEGVVGLIPAANLRPVPGPA